MTTEHTNDSEPTEARGVLLPLHATGGALVPCEAIADLLAAFADDGLHGREAQQVQHHLTTCAACTAEVTDLRTILGALHDLPRDRADPGEAFWTALAADIAQVVQTVPFTPPVMEVPEVAELPSNVVTLRRRGWQLTAVVGAALAAAAALALMISPPAHRTPEDQPTVADRAGNWFELPALQLDDDMSASESDPLQTVDDLDDNELELVDSALGDGV